MKVFDETLSINETESESISGQLGRTSKFQPCCKLGQVPLSDHEPVRSLEVESEGKPMLDLLLLA